MSEPRWFRAAAIVGTWAWCVALAWGIVEAMRYR